MTAQENSVISKIKDTLMVSLPSDGFAVLYGSRARGEAREDSDWDILVVVNKETLSLDDYTRITYPLTMLGWELGETINPVMYTNKEWEESKATPFRENVEHDGIRLS